jgi:hypothetical protein
MLGSLQQRLKINPKLSIELKILSGLYRYLNRFHSVQKKSNGREPMLTVFYNSRIDCTQRFDGKINFGSGQANYVR